MNERNRCLALLSVSLLVIGATTFDARGQGRKGHERSDAQALVSLTVDMTAHIRDFYGSRPASGVKALPPGMRNRLGRGKALPPGIAKQVAPDGLRSRLSLPRGYDLLEVGLDVLLVEVATGIVHDVLMDVVR